jgi:hypothetical protein
MYAALCGGSFVEAQNALLSECSLFEGSRCFRVLYVQGAVCFRGLHGSRCSMLECSMLEGAPMFSRCSILRVRCAIIAGILAYD